MWPELGPYDDIETEVDLEVEMAEAMEPLPSTLQAIKQS
jgi:hypothetical protein